MYICFTMLCWFILYSKVNKLNVYMYPISFGFPSHFNSVQSLSHVWLFVTPWTAGCQASLSFTISQSLLKLMSIESVMPSSHVIRLSTFFSCHQYFPASESFLTSWLFTSGGQSIETSASASVLLLNIQDWFPLGLIDWFGLLAVQGTLKSLLQHHC